MKVILLEDVYKHGVAGEVVNVAPGYGRNYLLPRRLAVKATPGLMRQYENLRKQADMRRAERQKEYHALAEQIGQLELLFGMKAGEGGKLYGSVTPAQIAEEIKALIGLEVDRRRIGDRPLRELGTFDVPVRLDAGIAPTVRVVIYPEGQDPREFQAQMAAAQAEAEAQAAAMEEYVEEAVIEEAAAADEVVEETPAAEEE